eukprot:TRINITY_DN4908_c0_g1_i3.p2 TRINITY_DN4908_c0_g1~~TRINITY_DN4908_c0_g1_i3.p2  ORF type:complete len:131 (-),score=12.73 TRINITY_DN4908_c0_g1_i3:8-400(-)
MWDQEGLSSRLGPTEFGIADKGYIGVDRLLTPWKGKGQNQKQKAWNYSVESSRVMVENAFSRLALFKILATAFRGKREKMHQIANVCAQLVNMDLNYRPIRKKTAQELCDYYCSRGETIMNNAVYKPFVD